MGAGKPEGKELGREKVRMRESKRGERRARKKWKCKRAELDLEERKETRLNIGKWGGR